MTEPAPDIPSIHLRSTADLVEAIPHLLGFHPVNSVVVAELQQWRERLGALIRIDLPILRDAAAAGRLLASHVRRAGADGVVIVVYGADRPPDDEYGAAVARDIGATLQAAGLELLDAAWVGGGRWRSYLCWNDLCCPADGNPIPDAAGPASAAATVAGMTRLPDRQALVESLRPGPAAAMTRAVARALGAFAVARSRPHTPAAWGAGTRERFRRAIVRAHAAGRFGQRSATLTDDEVGRLLVGLIDGSARDACWQLLETVPSSAALEVCWQLARRSIPPFRPAPLFLLGWTAWRRGDGALARIASEQALREDGGYTAALLLLDMLDHGVRPGDIPRLNRQPVRQQRRRRL